MTKTKIGRILSISCAMLSLVMGLLLIFCSAHLYFTGADNPYTRERVGQYLGYILIPAIIAAIAFFAGVIYNAVNSESDVKKAPRTAAERLGGMLKRYDIKSLPEDRRAPLVSDRKGVFAVTLTLDLMSAAMLCLSLIYLSFFATLTVEDLTRDVTDALFAVLLPAAAALILRALCLYLKERAAARELHFVMLAIKDGTITRAEAMPDDDREELFIKVARYSVIALAIIFIILGVFNGGMADVIGKAVKICTECIGLG